MISLNLQEQEYRQAQILSFLVESPVLWDTAESKVTDIERVETHGATVLLGKYYALKIKKAVHFDHMDYSSLQKRRHFCQREFSFNQETAPTLYLAVAPVFINPEGDFSLQGPGEEVEYFLKMRRFPKGSRLDEVANRSGLPTPLLDTLTDTISDFHKRARQVSDPNDVPDFHDVIEANFRQLDGFCPDLLDLQDVKAFRSQLQVQVERQCIALSSRISLGWVRWGHGDLHLQNICLLDGKPLIFDAIEYQDAFVISDILYDLSFLIMDLCEKNFRKSANQIFNRYLLQMGWMRQTAELAALALLPFYLSMRAGIRTHVEGNRYHQSSNRNQKASFAAKTAQLFDASRSYLNPPAPIMVAIGGFSGSGKSTLAANLAPYLGAAPGAVHVRSDILRRQILNWDEFSPMPQSAYTPDMSDSVYAKMREIAEAVLKTGHSVILDAVLDRVNDQREFENVANRLNIPFTGIWLDVKKDVMKTRIEGRTRDASDATVDVLENQMTRNDKKKQSWTSLDGNGNPEQSLSLSLSLLAKPPG